MHELIGKYHEGYRRKVMQTTFQNDKYILPEFARLMATIGLTMPGYVTQEALEGWLEHLQTKQGNGSRTMLRKVTRVRDFYAWLVEEGYLLCSPVPDDFYQVKPKERLRPVPGRKKTEAIMERAGQSHCFPLRNRAILELCYGTGLRRMELRALNVSDVSGDEVRVRGKGGRERIVPLGERARECLARYIRAERYRIIKRRNPLEEALFVSRDGRRLHLGSYNAIMQLQVKSPYSLHSFRHACATHMLASGANIAVLQKLLGHEKLTTTQKYTRVEVSSLKEALKKFHPRG